MTVRVRTYRGQPGQWEVDISFTYPDGTPFRKRVRSPVSTKGGATRWGTEREREYLLKQPGKNLRKEVPTLAQFAPEFIDSYAIANRQKPSTIEDKRSRFRCILIPMLGKKRLDDIGNADVQRLKKVLRDRAPKTVNNYLNVLSKLLKVAVSWGVIEKMPCRLELLKVPPHEYRFLDFEEFERLIKGAREVGEDAVLVCLLGGEAGLRCGEIMALQWTDLDLKKGELVVRRSNWKGQESTPKSGKLRRIPMTERLRSALTGARHLRSPYVVSDGSRRAFTNRVVQGLVNRAVRVVGLTHVNVHALRHTFCSHLAMKGASPSQIQALAGHADLSTTQRYMHLSESSVDDAIRLLDERKPPSIWRNTGEGGETKS